MAQQAVYDAQGNPIQGNFFGSTTGFAMDPMQFAQAYQNINPYTQQAATNLFGGNVSNFISGGLGAAPGQGFETFMSRQANPLASLVSGQMSPLQQSLTDRATQLSGQAVENVLDRMSGLGATYSSAALKNAMAAGAAPFADVANVLGQQQLGLTGSLWGQQMGLAQQEQMQRAAQAAQLLGMQTGFGDPMFTAPDIVTTPSGFETMMGGIMDAGTLTTNILPLVL